MTLILLQASLAPAISTTQISSRSIPKDIPSRFAQLPIQSDGIWVRVSTEGEGGLTGSPDSQGWPLITHEDLPDHPDCLLHSQLDLAQEPRYLRAFLAPSPL